MNLEVHSPHAVARLYCVTEKQNYAKGFAREQGLWIVVQPVIKAGHYVPLKALFILLSILSPSQVVFLIQLLFCPCQSLPPYQ